MGCLATRPHAWLWLHLRYSSSSSSLTFGFRILIPICPTVDELIPGHGPRFPTASWMFPSGYKQSPQIQKAKLNPSSHSLHLYFLLGLHLITQVVNLRVLLDSQSSFPHANQPSWPNNFTCLKLYIFFYKIRLLLCISGSLQDNLLLNWKKHSMSSLL